MIFWSSWRLEMIVSECQQWWNGSMMKVALSTLDNNTWNNRKTMHRTLETDTWNNREMTGGTAQKWHVWHSRKDTWTSRNLTCGLKVNCHVDHLEEDTWVNWERTHGNMGKGHMALLISSCGLVLARHVVILFCDTCCPTRHLPTWTKPRGVQACPCHVT